MMLGMSLGLVAGRSGSGGVVLPTLRGTPTSSTTTEPTLPAHAVGDLLVVACGAASATNPTLTSGSWLTWGGPFTGASRSITVFYMIATATNHTIAITGETALRQAWVFANATIDDIDVGLNASSTAITWPSLSLTGSCLVGGFAYVVTAQTDITAILPSGMTERGNKDTSAAGIGFDSNTTYLTGTYAPAAGTLDTSSAASIAVLFSVKGA